MNLRQKKKLICYSLLRKKIIENSTTDRLRFFNRDAFEGPFIMHFRPFSGSNASLILVNLLNLPRSDLP